MRNPAVAYDAPDVHTIDVPADPNGLAYDRDRDALYVTDGETGAVLAIEHGRHRKLATIESGGVVASNRLGGVAIAPGGILYVVRLGHGHAGAIFRVDGNAVTALPHLSPTAWRLGVVYDEAEHALYATQYDKQVTGPQDGSIVRIDLATERVEPAVEGLCKPVGVAKLGQTLVITDGKRRTVHRAELVGGRAVSCELLASGIDRPDSIAACGPDSVVVSTFDADTRVGGVQRIWLDGRTQSIAHGDWEPRGVATDGECVFVAARRGGCVMVFRL